MAGSNLPEEKEPFGPKKNMRPRRVDLIDYLKEGKRQNTALLEGLECVIQKEGDSSSIIYNLPPSNARKRKRWRTNSLSRRRRKKKRRGNGTIK